MAVAPGDRDEVWDGLQGNYRVTLRAGRGMKSVFHSTRKATVSVSFSDQVDG